jgi:BlaI family transcriptional regulator, penicillinase repressor
MPPTSSPAVSDAELEVLKILWARGPSTVRDVETQLGRRKKWAYTTILTLLTRLREKGCVKQDRAADAHVFHAAITREQLLGRRLKELAETVCDGTAGPLVHALVRTRHLTPEDIAALRQKLDELEGRSQS